MGKFKKFLKLITGLKDIDKKIKRSFKKIREEIKDKISKKELELVKQEMQENIKEEVEKLRTELRSKVRTELKVKNVFEDKILQRAKRTRPELIKQAILQLLNQDMRTIDIENIMVREKNLCGKTQFYHYLGLLRTELRSGVRTELKVKKRP